MCDTVPLQRARAPVVSFFWNYNTVESVLLFSAVLITLAAVMFQSGQLSQPGFEAQKTFVTVVVAIVIAASTLYYFTVLVSEIYTMATANAKWRVSSNTDRSDLKRQVEMRVFRGASPAGEKDEGQEGGGGVSLNPLFTKGVVAEEENGTSQDATVSELMRIPLPNAGQWALAVKAMQTISDNNKKLAAEVTVLKRAVELSHTGASNRLASPSPSSSPLGHYSVAPRRAVKSTPRRRLPSSESVPDDASSLSLHVTGNPLLGQQ